jgi:hypothetical protein
MSKRIKTQLQIDAPAQRVWRELTNFASFPTWNPFIRRAEGRLEPGRRLRIVLRLGPIRLRFRPVVVVAETSRELRWRARIGPPGLLEVDRSFVLEPVGAGVRFTQEEVCRGLLAPLATAFGGEARLYRGYDGLNRALRARSEKARR